MGHLALADMVHIHYRPGPFHIDTIYNALLNSMDNCSLNPADKRYHLSGPLANLVLADMAHIPPRPSTSYRDSLPQVSSNSVENCGRNPADKQVSTDGWTDRRTDLNTLVPRSPSGGGRGTKKSLNLGGMSPIFL